MEAVSGRPVQREAWSIAALRHELTQSPADALKKYRVVFAEGTGVAWEHATTFNAAQGIGVVSVEQWARENIV